MFPCNCNSLTSIEVRCISEFVDQRCSEAPNINAGYRWNLSAKECFASIFMLHNDTVNVWTHFLGALYFVLVAPGIMDGETVKGASKALRRAPNVAFNLQRCLAQQPFWTSLSC
jgi:hypothetical protein